jgi:restriction system protein
MSEAIVWGIHAGRTGDGDTLFITGNVVALGWRQMGDLGFLPADREAFKARVTVTFPEKKIAAIPGTAGQMFRFMHEMKVGDFVVYPSKHRRRVHIGRVEGPYSYSPQQESSYPHRRPVRWLKDFPRSTFSQGALYEIGSALSFFQVKTYTEEFLRAGLEGVATAPPAAADETVALVAEEMEETTRDFILKKLAQELKGHPLADFVAHLLGTMGYRTRVSPEGPDGGVDIIAHRDELGFEPPIIKVQVKSTEGSVGDSIVSALLGKVSAGEFGLLVTLGTFTAPATSFARNKSNLRLVDGSSLVDLILQHYESFDSRYKGLLPLKRVYIPEPIEEPED